MMLVYEVHRVPDFDHVFGLGFVESPADNFSSREDAGNTLCHGRIRIPQSGLASLEKSFLLKI